MELSLPLEYVMMSLSLPSALRASVNLSEQALGSGVLHFWLATQSKLQAFMQNVISCEVSHRQKARCRPLPLTMSGWCCSAHEVYIDEEQMRWFKGALREAAGRPVIVYSHAPPQGCGLTVIPVRPLLRPMPAQLHGHSVMCFNSVRRMLTHHSLLQPPGGLLEVGA